MPDAPALLERIAGGEIKHQEKPPGGVGGRAEGKGGASELEGVPRQLSPARQLFPW